MLFPKKIQRNIELVSEQLADANEFVSDVVSGIHRSAIVYGPPGLGKTHMIEAALKKKGLKVGEDYLVARSHITPRQLYAMLYCMREAGQFVIVDDCDAVLTSEDGLNLLKAATDSTFRTVGWASSTTGVKLPTGESIPNDFTFNGTVIIATNVRQAMRGKAGQHFAALRSRCPGWALNWSSKDEQFAYLCHMIFTVNYLANDPGTDLSDNQKCELVEFIQINLDKIDQLDLRKPQHIARVMRSKPNWQNQALKFLTDGV